ncbi:MAG: hypothetical protein ACOX7G_06645 [Candidatus Scatomorpha sp.]|jgi:hypothetical protein
MKKALPLLILCALLLTACSSRGTHGVSGKVVELHSGPEGLESFVIDSNGELLGVMLTDRTYVLSWLDALSAEDFLSGSAPDAAVTVYFDGSKSRLVTGSGEEIKAQEAETVYITGFLRPDAVSLADGTELDVWQYENATAYAAEDGTELLKVAEPIGPADTYNNGLSLNDLGETAQANITAWFEARGALYDEQAELERAYAAWSGAEDASDFQTWGLSQRIVPTALSERVIYFLTTVERPVGSFVMEQQRIGSAFDRETGEYLEAWELFTCPPDEAVQRILDLSELTESEQRAELEAAFEPECLTIFEDRLEVSFERGVLPSCESGFTLVLDLDEDVLPLLHPWAVPQKGSET